MINRIPLILNSSHEQLRSLDHVEGLIKEFGLFRDERNLYGEPYNSWQNEGPGIWQQPRQLARFLIWMSDKEIKSYLDVGTFYGYTFTFITAYLSKFGLTHAVALDSNHYFENFDEARQRLIGVSMNYVYREGPIERQGHTNYTEVVRGRMFDFVFIDGNHNYSAIMTDYLNVGKYAKYCAFHDVNDEHVEKECEKEGAVGFWKYLVSNPHENMFFQKYWPRTTEFLDHPDGKRIMGIGVIER